MPANLVIDYPDPGKLVRLRTPGEYSMDTAVKILRWLDNECCYDVPDTGWKSGFGLEVAVPITIRGEGIEIALETDGDTIEITRLSGSREKFDELCESNFGAT